MNPIAEPKLVPAIIREYISQSTTPAWSVFLHMQVIRIAIVEKSTCANESYN
mgnify:CR=1 FL=1